MSFQPSGRDVCASCGRVAQLDRHQDICAVCWLGEGEGEGHVSPALLDWIAAIVAAVGLVLALALPVPDAPAQTPYTPAIEETP